MNTKTNIGRTIDLLIADDHQMVRDGLRVMLFSKKASIQFNIREAETSQEAIQKSLENKFQVILMDYDLPDDGGPYATREILKANPAVKILALSHNDELVYIEEMIDAGALGYIIKNIEPGQLIQAIKTVLEGGTFFSNEASRQLRETGRRIKSAKGKKPVLTRREREVLKYIASELTTKEIATELSISTRTVETHRQNISAKLEVKTAVGLVKAAYSLGIVW